MDWLSAMNNAVDYIETNITGRINAEDAAKAAFSSTFHFQRMFYMIAGVTVSEYIRRRRLTLAANDIIAGMKVIDAAHKYGYETPEAFTKSFKKMYGISPVESRQSGISLRSYPRLSFEITIKGDKDINYRIIHKESFTVVGRQTRTTMKEGQNFSQVPEFWNACIKDGSYLWLSSKAGKLGIMGVSSDFDQDAEEFNYTIAIENIDEEIPPGFASVAIPEAKWAVFQSVGSVQEAAHEMIRRIYMEWMPSMGYEHDCAPDIEVYPEGDMHSDSYKCEIWVPIITRSDKDA